MQLGKTSKVLVSEGRSQLTTPLLPVPHPAQQQRSCRVFARERGRDARGAGPSVSHVSVPRIEHLVSEHKLKDGVPTSDAAAVPMTVYTIRFTTGISRGAALSDPNAAVNVCLIGRNGTAALHRVSPVNDPLESRAHTVEMCQMIGPDVGADCSIALAEAAAGQPQPPQSPQQPSQAPPQSPPQPPQSASPPPQQGRLSGGAAGSGAYGFGGSGGASGTSLVGRPPPPPPPKRRFQEGAVDEVSVLVPELGPLAGVLVGLEGGSWYLDELDVVSSRTRHLDRFVCRRTLGGRPGEGAALLTPVPVGAVVYGEGEAAVVLSKDQAAALWSLNMADYADMKRRLAATTALLVASGASMAALTGGTAAALPYAAGGVVGLVYQWLLMRGVDHVVEAAAGSHGPHSHANTSTSTVTSPGTPSSAAPGAGAGAGTGTGGGAAPAPAGRIADFGLGGGGGGGPPASSSGAAGRVLASAPVRLGFVCASAALGLALLSQEETATEVATGALPTAAAGADAIAAGAGAGPAAAAWQLALAALGFLTYKVAMVGVSLGDSGGGGGGLGGLGVAALQRSASSSGGGGGNGQLEKYKRD